MGKDADSIHATALANAFGVPIHVVNLDTSFSSGKVGPDYVLSPRNGTKDVSNVPAPGSGPTKDGSSASESSSPMGRRQVLTVTLLYRPGQYDIIYPREKTS
uniref:Uncharacterized protein n=1 Tax=Ananas comosus var. bracteatus TaxID=296719 RepID=A0A6V7NPE2_ANACO|nr:unnamed protein product [Ananas comosus var. bracteatus]